MKSTVKSDTKALKDVVALMQKDKKLIGCALDRWIVIDVDKILARTVTIQEAMRSVESVARHEFSHVLYTLMFEPPFNVKDAEDFATRMQSIYDGQITVVPRQK